ncbi:hypothetical protein BJ166DRAFT_473400 [Pestalotiopsis sp. NC0098]|nr:hypothetical protein BJ166DRAFT_473400 [Pestalotiopsis sp. NC0098]
MLGSWQGPLGCIGRFCVWSSDTSPGDGLSIITTNTNSRIVQNTTASVEITYKSPAFRTVNIANKGVGMVAAEPIRRGQRILAAKPAILVHRSLIDELADESQHKLLDLAIDHLSPEARRQEFMAQAGELGGHKVKDIMFTNSFQINLGGHDGQHFGNFPEVSRFNHDCRPNVAFYIDDKLTHHTHAIRDIKPGEELTISYLDSFRARDVRQQRAHASWGFACTCSQCSLSKDEADESDARLFSIYKVENLLADLGNRQVSPDMIEQLIELYQEERLHFKIADAYTLAALNYNILGMTEMARKYAQLSIEQGLIEHGPDAPDIEAMRLLLADARGHWTYNRRGSRSREALG